MGGQDLHEQLLRLSPAVRDWRLATLALAAVKCGQTQAPARGGKERSVDWGKKLDEELEHSPDHDVFVYALRRPLRRLLSEQATELSADIAPYVCRPLEDLRTLTEAGREALHLLLRSSTDAGLLELGHYEKESTRVQDYTGEEGLVEALIYCDLSDAEGGPEAFDKFVREKMKRAFERTQSRGEVQWDKHLRLSYPVDWEDGRAPKGLVPVDLLLSEAPDAHRNLVGIELLELLTDVVDSVVGAARSDTDATALKRYWYAVLRDERPKLGATVKRAFFMSVNGSTVSRADVEFSDTTSAAAFNVLLKRRRWLALTWKESARAAMSAG